MMMKSLRFWVMNWTVKKFISRRNSKLPIKRNMIWLLWNILKVSNSPCSTISVVLKRLLGITTILISTLPWLRMSLNSWKEILNLKLNSLKLNPSNHSSNSLLFSILTMKNYYQLNSKDSSTSISIPSALKN